MFQFLLASIWQLIRKPGHLDAREFAYWYTLFLSWKPLSTHLACALRKFPCLSVLMVSTHLPSHNFSIWPSSGHKGHKPRCQPRICAPNAVLQQTLCSILVLLELSFPSCTGSISCSNSYCFSGGSHTAFQHISGSTVNSFWIFNSYVTEVIGHLIEAQWSLYAWQGGQIVWWSSCFPFFCCQKTKCSGCCGTLVCFRRHCPMVIDG